MTATSETVLTASAWFSPGEFAKVADAFGLHDSDFGDRLCSVVCAYLRVCGERGATPTIRTANAVLDEFAVPRDFDDLFYILIEPPTNHGDSLTDLIRDVQRDAAIRAESECRALARDALRAIQQTFDRRHCIRRFTTPRLARKRVCYV